MPCLSGDQLTILRRCIWHRRLELVKLAKHLKGYETRWGIKTWVRCKVGIATRQTRASISDELHLHLCNKEFVKRALKLPFDRRQAFLHVDRPAQ